MGEQTVTQALAPLAKHVLVPAAGIGASATLAMLRGGGTVLGALGSGVAAAANATPGLAAQGAQSLYEFIMERLDEESKQRIADAHQGQYTTTTTGKKRRTNSPEMPRSGPQAIGDVGSSGSRPRPRPRARSQPDAATEEPFVDPRTDPKFQKGVPKLQYTTEAEWGKKGKGVLVQQLWARPGLENYIRPGMTQRQLAREMDRKQLIDVLLRMDGHR